LTSSNFCAILYPVSERNTMKNQMTITEIRRHFIQRQRMDQMREWKAMQLDMTTPENERLTWEQFKHGTNRDHRGRSNDDCPLIVKLQEELKQKKMFEAAEAVGSTNGGEILDFGCEC